MQKSSLTIELPIIRTNESKDGFSFSFDPEVKVWMDEDMKLSDFIQECFERKIAFVKSDACEDKNCGHC